MPGKSSTFPFCDNQGVDSLGADYSTGAPKDRRVRGFGEKEGSINLNVLADEKLC